MKVGFLLFVMFWMGISVLLMVLMIFGNFCMLKNLFFIFFSWEFDIVEIEIKYRVYNMNDF